MTGATAVPTRISFSLSPGGTYAACLTGTGDGPLRLERWRFDGLRGEPRVLPGLAYSINTQLLALDDGTVLVTRTRQGVAEVWQVTPDDATGRIAAIPAYGLSLQPVPRQGRPVVAISYAEDGSTLWRVADDRSALHRLLTVPDLLVGGTWLDPEAGLLAVAVHRGGTVKADLLNLDAGTLTPLLNVTPTSNDRVLAASPETGLMLVSTDAVGGEHVGWVQLGGEQPAQFPAVLHERGEVMRPVCVDPGGRRVLMHRTRGARSQLAVFTPTDGTLVDVAMPEGRAFGVGRWADGLIRLPFCAPTQPTTITASVVQPTAHTVHLTGVPSDVDGSWAPAHLEEVAGADGPIEAIVYGGPAWRTAEHLVVALHGGPRTAWHYDFDPVFQRFAAAGIAILAPNQRGSTGYGPAHTDAIHAAWGGPDLADILRIGADLRAARQEAGLRPPAVFGASYGAYLSLLAASCGPDLWSRCVALSGFTSAARLYEDGPPAVRELIDMYDARTELHDEFGPRDLLRLCHRITVPVLLGHGTDDEIIPVAHTRAVYREMRAGPVRYVEVPDADHSLSTGSGGHRLVDDIVTFLTAGAP